MDNDFVVNSSDTCVCSKMIGSDCVIICLYVDEMLIFGPNVNVINDMKKILSSKFEMKDIGEENVISVVQVKRTCNGFFLCQCNYIENMFKSFDCFDVVSLRTP